MNTLLSEVGGSFVKYSIIVPVYNAETTLERCVKSILQQEFGDFELLLIDDGSTDKSGEICNQFATKDCRVKVAHQNNKGVSGARNLGLELAQGKRILFIDSDDYVENDYISTFEKMDKDLLITGHQTEGYNVQTPNFCLYEERVYDYLSTQDKCRWKICGIDGIIFWN